MKKKSNINKRRKKAKGRGKRKGSAFERVVCKQLSLWVSGGERQDLFWRSAMSGGRATVGGKKGLDLRYQAGDISAVQPMGDKLTGRFYIECKSYKTLSIGSFLFGRSCDLLHFWKKTKEEAARYQRKPMLIAKYNGGPVFVVLRARDVDGLAWAKLSAWVRSYDTRTVILSFDRMIQEPFNMRVRI